MRNSKFLAAAAVAVPALALSQPAMAGSNSGDMAVSALVLDNCTVVAGPLNFGSITDLGSSDVNAQSTITLACTPNAGFQVGLDDGDNANAGQRRLTNTANGEFIAYEVYSDGGYSTRWGNTLDTDTVSGTANAAGVASLTAYGQIASGVNSVSAGLYTDTITVTVNF